MQLNETIIYLLLHCSFLDIRFELTALTPLAAGTTLLADSTIAQVSCIYSMQYTSDNI